MCRRKGVRPSPVYLTRLTLDLRFLQGTQAEEMHLLFFESSAPASRFPLRPFLAGVSELGGCASAVLLVSMTELGRFTGDARCGVMVGRAL